MSARLIMKLEVLRVEELAGDVRRYTLRHPLRPILPAPEPGSHVDVRLPDSRVRQYSLCGDPADASRYVVAVQRADEGRGGSVWLHEHWQPGTVAHVSAPRNHFPLAEAATHHLLIGGGIGITPLVAMAWHLERVGASFTLAVLARDHARAPFLGELASRHGRRVQVYLSQAAPAKRFDPDAALASCGPGTHVYCCGPRRLTDAVRAAGAGWPEDRVHTESFVPLADDGTPREAFDILLKRSGRVVKVSARQSALDALREAGCMVPSSCGIGVCGTCECSVLAGQVLHRDVVLDGAARRRAMLPCVSRAVGCVTLDL